MCGCNPLLLESRVRFKKDSESSVHVENEFESSFFSNSASKSNIRIYLRPGRTCKNPEYDLKRVWIPRTKRGVIPSRVPLHVHVGIMSVISSYKVCLSVLSVFVEIGTYNRRAYSYNTLTIYTIEAGIIFLALTSIESRSETENVSETNIYII